MNKFWRRILLFCFLIIFFLAGPSLVLYYQGYRLDFHPANGRIKLVQTGGIFVKTIPKQVEIYLDGKLVKKTDPFFSSTLIENLLPKKYLLEVKKDGFYPWKKNLEVKEEAVIEVGHIILFSKKIDFRPLAGGVENFWFSPDGKKLVLREKEGSLWTLKMYEMETGVKSQVVKESDLSKKGAELFALEFSADSKEIYLKTGVGEREKDFVLNLTKSPPGFSEKPNSTATQSFLTYQQANGNIFYLDNSGNIFKTDSSFSSKEKLNSEPFPVSRENPYRLFIFQNYIFLDENGQIYYFNQDTKIFEKFANRIISLKLSPDQAKIAYFSDYEIQVLFLNTNRPPGGPGESIFLVRLSDKIKDVFWLNKDYLVFNTESAVKVCEIDNRDRVNIVDLAEIDNPKIFWNQADGKLYVLSQGNLSVSDKILP